MSKITLNKKSLKTLVTTSVINEIDYMSKCSTICLLDFNNSSYKQNNLERMISDIENDNISYINNLTFNNHRFFDEVKYNA